MEKASQSHKLGCPEGMFSLQARLSGNVKGSSGAVIRTCGNTGLCGNHTGSDNVICGIQQLCKTQHLKSQTFQQQGHCAETTHRPF